MSVIPTLPSEILRCPACAGAFEAGDDVLRCVGCRRAFPVEEGIPRLFWPNEWEPGRDDVTESIKAFYEQTPFPNYEDTDTLWSLREKAERGVFARLLNEQVAPRARILEAGCGTGQLSNFLAAKSGRMVFGTDICLNSLRLGQAFKVRNRLDNVSFLQMNLFRPVFPKESFDVVISNGVLHHTSDPELGFRTLTPLLKPGGLVIIGLYNRFGRLSTDLRRKIFRLTRGHLLGLDPRLRRENIGLVRKRTWFKDQYQNPHESKHTIGEVLGWFREAGVEFLTSLPHAVAFDPFTADEQLFEKRPAGTRLDHALVQLRILWTGGREGGFFTMIGRRPPA
jgi:2-polyprenyl-3-methyl-5-hydroxy-6-metoxy-1,4-benzoquinol methylase/uncharacterized protein YbaR (Trm112 family)